METHHWMIHAGYFIAGMLVMAAAVFAGRALAYLDTEEADHG